MHLRHSNMADILRPQRGSLRRSGDAGVTISETLVSVNRFLHQLCTNF